jgi:hypothetical protein
MAFDADNTLEAAAYFLVCLQAFPKAEAADQDN